jgi:Xaa-Pro aminopeptidase
LAANASTGDGRLKALLQACGGRRDPDEVRGIIEGVLAAPQGHEPDAWLDLIAPADAAELRALLLELKGEIARSEPKGEPPVAERLSHLRRELERQGVHGLILPLTDEHRSEYMPAASRRLTWLTGFTGSAGLCVVLPERAALFVDGRYTLQAETELDPALFEARHVTGHPPADWIKDTLRAGERLGYDANLHIRSEVARYREAAERAGGEIVALEANPVDAIWATRPPLPIAPVEVLDVAYAGEASEAKRVRMGEIVAKAGAELAVIPATDSIAWLLNIRGGDVPYNPLVLAFALLHADGAVELFLDPRKLKPGQNLGNGVAIQPIEAFGDAVAALGLQGRPVMVDPSVVSIGVIERLRAAGARLIEGDEPCRLAKATKNEVELEGARAAQIRDGAAVCRFLHWLETETARRTVTELEAAARIDQERRRDPLFRGPSFPTISGAGPNGAIVHYRVTKESDRALEPGSLYLVDSGGQYLDATTDITRTVAIGEPDADMRRHFTLVLKGHIAIAQAVFPEGTTGGQLDTLAREALWRAGLDYDHGTGHGVGAYLCVHEGPARISKAGSGPTLQPGMILSNEPGHYRSGAYGIRIENLVAVRAHARPEGGERDLLGFETLTRAPIDRRLIEAGLLDADERAWLDGYHARVRADLSGLLEGEAASWLVSATRTIG